MMVCIEVVIELDDTVVTVTRGRVRGEEIARFRGEIRDVGRPEVRLHLLGYRALAHRRIGSVYASLIGKHRCGRIEVRLRGFGILARKANRVFLPLVRDEPECLVLDDWSTKRQTVILVAQRRLAAW